MLIKSSSYIINGGDEKSDTIQGGFADMDLTDKV
jgi:hypothetical protein